MAKTIEAKIRGNAGLVSDKMMATGGPDEADSAEE
jgi:hypothetical protein